MKFSLKRDAWTVYASRNSLAIEMKTRHLLRVEFSIKKVSSRVFFKDDLTVLDWFIGQLSCKVLYQKNYPEKLPNVLQVRR